MTGQRRKHLRAVALLLVFALGQTYVYSAPAATSIVEDTTAPALQDQLTGRLSATKPITVNGNSAATGDTIFSGAQIQTPAGASATVQLPSLGSLEIGENTSLTITFEAGRVNVTVTSGCVTLRTNRGVAGAVITPQGETRQSKGGEASTIDICRDRPVAVGTAGGLGTIGVIGFIGAAALIISAPFISNALDDGPAADRPSPSPF